MKTLLNNDSIQDLETELQKNGDLQEKFKANPLEALRNVESRNPKDFDYWIYRIIVCALGFAVLVIIAGLVIISINRIPLENQLITIFTAISSGAIGALAGLLSPSPSKTK